MLERRWPRTTGEGSASPIRIFDCKNIVNLTGASLPVWIAENFSVGAGKCDSHRPSRIEIVNFESIRYDEIV